MTATTSPRTAGDPAAGDRPDSNASGPDASGPDASGPDASGDVHPAAAALDAFATWAIRSTASRDLSLTTAATLSTLARSGPLRLSDLAGREGVTQPSMTALVSRLERDGLAARSADPDDGRAVNVSITDAGRDALDARRHRRAATLATLLEAAADADRAVIVAAAPALARLAGAAPATRPREQPDARTTSGEEMTEP